ncbi:MAG: hypothetical protein R3B13_33090 [Polyangiaceae bacterium]
MRCPVKYPVLPGRRFRRWNWLPCAVAVAVLALPAGAQSRRSPSPLFGGPAPSKRPPVVTDPWLPQGNPLGHELERPHTQGRACSASAPVCVHWQDEQRATAERALAVVTKAYRKLVYALRLPEPLADLGLGGSDALDLYLVDDGSELAVHRTATRLGAFDSSAAFCTLGSAYELERAATLCVAEAIAWRVNASTAPHLKRAYATHAWQTLGSPTASDLEGLDDLQSNPQLGVATRDLSELSEASSIWFEYLDQRLGRGDPLGVSTALLSASATQTPASGFEWHAEPDAFDVLRHTFDDKPRQFAEFFLGFAVARAFVGSRDDGSHLPSLSWAGSFGAARFDWVLPFSTLPRRVGVLRPLAPTGSVYLWLPLDKVPEGKSLGFQAQWESPATFHWALVRVDGQGRELGRLIAPFSERGNEVQQSIVDLKGTAGILVVGTNLGGVDPAHPFDPDVAPHEPHGCTVYLAAI